MILLLGRFAARRIDLKPTYLFYCYRFLRFRRIAVKNLLSYMLR